MSIQPFRKYRYAAIASRLLLTVACGAALSCCAASAVSARQIVVVIQPAVDSHARVFIEVIGGPLRIWSFPNSYAGVTELGNRIERLEAFDTAGAEISVRQIAPGQFEAATHAARFRYEVNLAPPAQPPDSARVSWLTGFHGLLMLGDLLPANRSEPGKGSNDEKKGSVVDSATVRFKLPDTWTVYSNERQDAEGDFTVTDVDRAVFAVGGHLRSSQVSVSGMTLRLVATGEWAFADGEALKLGADVLKVDHEVFGAMPSKQGTLILLPFPQPAAASKWTAETRGSTVMLLMGKLPSKTAALLQLSVPLTHELFHLWVPNALALAGDYDWFYEGFTVYQAARTAVRMGQLTFQEFLSAIARAYDAYAAGVDHDRWSLVEASRRRWTVGEPSVYSKSMVIAFLCDLKLRSSSRGKRSLDGVYRELFRQYRSAEEVPAEAERRRDGSETAIDALSSSPGMQDFTDAFIRRPVAIDLGGELSPLGLRVERLGLRTLISVGESLTRQQRDLLRELGYNDYARAPTQKKRS